MRALVWTAEQTAVFLTSIAAHPLRPLLHLIVFTGMRRGEACGLRWADLDLRSAGGGHPASGTMSVAQQIVQLGWGTETRAPKSDAGQRRVALDHATVDVLLKHRRDQRRRRLNAGPEWVDTGLVFTTATGRGLHPAEVSDTFTDLVAVAGLPPIRLHDLRHGTATHALAAGVDIKIVQEILGHSSSTITRDIYTTVIDDAKHAAAQAIADIIAGAHRPTHP